MIIMIKLRKINKCIKKKKKRYVIYQLCFDCCSAVAVASKSQVPAGSTVLVPQTQSIILLGLPASDRVELVLSQRRHTHLRTQVGALEGAVPRIM